MSTLASRLRAQLDPHLRPLLAELDAAAEGLAALPVPPSADAALERLGALRRRLDALLERLASQRSYVLLFGPLKSGKSTLMNALGAAYVSEVTSLPAYPCMVYVAHSPRLEVALTRYDGAVEVLPDLAAMHDRIAAAHGELARAIREAERCREEFEPRRHLPQAIRRVDVRLPAPELLESGTVLVDTPGLYTRMKFGYDQMTREFRSASAGAIFVVKTDNLFLDSVFDEFEDLLRLFSRIFLVVNLDGAKRDLAPDGRLDPSLEGREPGRILEAFEELAMSAALERAHAEGRLSIHGIDLLQAASARLQGDDGAPGEFERFLGDLGDYLNGGEIVVAFVRDSLRQAAELLAELHAECDGETARAAARLLAEAEAARAAWSDRAAAARRLAACAWDRCFEPAREDHTSITRERSVALRDKALAGAEAAIERWCASDASLADLLDHDLAGVLGWLHDELADLARDSARTVLGSDLAAAGARRAAGADLATVDLPVAAITRAALEALPAWRSDRDVVLHVPTDLIPVRRSLLDWLLLRSPAAVRRRLLGPPEAPGRPIPAVVKHKRLGERGRAALSAAVRVRLERDFGEALGQGIVATFATAVAAAAQRLRAELERLAAEAEAARRQADDAVARRVALCERVERLADGAGRATAEVERRATEQGVDLAERVAPATVASSDGGAAAGELGDPAAPELGAVGRRDE